jgi:hypothetical protein
MHKKEKNYSELMVYLEKAKLKSTIVTSEKANALLSGKI